MHDNRCPHWKLIHIDSAYAVCELNTKYCICMPDEPDERCEIYKEYLEEGDE